MEYPGPPFAHSTQRRLQNRPIKRPWPLASLSAFKFWELAKLSLRLKWTVFPAYRVGFPLLLLSSDPSAD